MSNNYFVEEKLGKPEWYNSVDFVKNLPTSVPRLIKTHLCYEMLPHQVREKKPLPLELSKFRSPCV